MFGENAQKDDVNENFHQNSKRYLKPSLRGGIKIENPENL